MRATGLVGLAPAHARGRLVQQDGVGAARDGDPDLQRALLGVGEEPGGEIAPRLEVDVGEEALGRVVQRPLASQQLPERVPIAARPEEPAADVLEHAQAREDRRDLKAARQASPGDLVGRQAVDAPAVQLDLAGRGREAPADHVEQRGLAGAVRTDDRVARARGHVEAHPMMTAVGPKFFFTSVRRSAGAVTRASPRP
jgi:hypothetical protein